MSKHDRFSLVAMSALAAGLLLAACSGPDKDAPTPAGAASAAESMVPMAPVAYVPEPAAAVITTCNIEGFDKAPFQATPIEAALSRTHSISGWIAAPQLAAPSFWLRLDDNTRGRNFQVKLTPSIKRADVAASTSNPALPENSGFLLELPIKAVPAGLYHLYLVAQADGKPNICDGGWQVNFK